MDTLSRNEKRTAGNENTALLKWIALAFMVTDHVGAALFPSVTDMRLLGRIAFPIYAWCLVVGACYTASFPKYCLRLLVVGIVSQPFYMCAFAVPWYELNVFFTLLISVAAMWGIREKKFGSQYFAPALCLLLSLVIDMDYGWRGLTFILLLYAVRTSRRGIAALFIAFCCFWADGSLTLKQIFGIPTVSYLSFLPQAASLLKVLGKVEFYAILALPFVVCGMPTKKKVWMPQWVGYAVYPFHLCVIALIKTALGA